MSPKTKCCACDGVGSKNYPNTGIWHSSQGGSMVCRGVCDSCWGSGNVLRVGPNLRELVEENERLRVENARLRGCKEELGDHRGGLDIDSGEGVSGDFKNWRSTKR